MANDNLKIGGEKGFVESEAQKRAREQFLASANKSATEAEKTIQTTEIELPVSPISAEIDMGQAPPLVPDTTPTLASIAGILEETQAGLTQVSEALKAVEPPKEEEPTGFQKLYQSLQEKVLQRPAPVPAEEQFKQAQTTALAQLGLTSADVANMQNIRGQLTAFNKEIADLEAQRDFKKIDVERRGGSFTTGILRGELSLIDRQFNSRIAAKAAQALVVAQQLTGLREDVQLSNQIATQITNLAIHDQEQKVRDFEWTFDTYQDLFQIMDRRETEEWNRSYQLAQDERDAAKEVAQLMANNPNAGIVMTDTFEEASQKIAQSGGTAEFQLELARETRLGAEGVATGFTKTQRLKLEQAGLVDASRQEQLDFLYGDEGKPVFTQTQLNKGAATAMMSMEEFLGLDPDTQNFFINNSSTVNAKVKLINEDKENNEDPTEIEREISGSNAPDEVKDVLVRHLWTIFPRPAQSGKAWYKPWTWGR